jgi:phospholipase C
MTGSGGPSSSEGFSPTSRARFRTHWIVGAVAAAVVALVVVVATWGIPGPGPSTTAGCGRTWLAAPTTTTPVKHLFVIVKENHAFENYFGTLPGVAGYPPNGSFPVAFNSTTVVHPFPLPGDSTPDLPHDAASDLTDYNGGLDNLFVATANSNGAPDPANAVGYYTEGQIPAYFEYARNYTVGDHFFTGVLGPTNPNRVFDISAYVGSWNADTSPPANVTDRPTVLGQLTDANLPWEYDYEGLPFVLAPYGFSALTSDPCSASRITAVENLATQLSGPAPPSVVYIDPSDSLAFSEHPPENVTVGEEWTVSVVNSILGSSVGSSSAIVLFFDENGGFWDPVPPPLTSTGRDGFRVPFVVISPWTPAGKVCHSVVDSASVLNFIDTNWGLPFLNARVASAGNLSCFFDFSQAPRAPIVLPTDIGL